LLYTLNNYLGDRIPNLFPQWFYHLELPNWPLSLFIFFDSYTLFMDNLVMAFILLNRFTAIVRPTTHENVFELSEKI
jgi:hypothetical protein